MKIVSFDLSGRVSAQPQGTKPSSIQGIKVPGLDAYAISNAFVHMNGVSALVDGTNASIIGDVLQCRDFEIDHADVVILQIYYHGIRDYSALFPSVKGTEPARADRMGSFFKEAEVCFEQGAWTSFMLMSAAIFEHLLYFKLGSPGNVNTLSQLNRSALQRSAISQHAHGVISSTNNARNVIHCNRMGDPDITRTQAMDAKTVIDELMRAF